MPGWSEPNGGVGTAREGFASPTMGLSGWSLGDEQGASPVEARDRGGVTTRTFSRPTSLGRLVVRGLTIAFSVVGAATGALVLGFFARETGHPSVDVAKIACLGAVAGASIGAAVIPVIRALAWSVVATSIAAVGAGALWFVHRLDPLLLRTIFDRLW